MIPQRLYHLKGMKTEMWDMDHPHYGQPFEIIGIYLGAATMAPLRDPDDW